MPESPEQWFHRRATHYVESQMLFHLSRAGVFRLLDVHPRLTIDAISRELRLVPDLLETCLDYICGVDSIIDRDGHGGYGLTDFGRSVVARYSREDGDQKRYNFFDVRVGAYGPVWSGLGSLLSGDVRYGDGLVRAGEVAEEAVYTVSARMLAPLQQRLSELCARSVIEVGVSTGLLPMLRQQGADWIACGVDRSLRVLDKARARAEQLGVTDIQWRQADFFEPESWLDITDDESIVFSVHLHELMAGGQERMVRTLRGMGQLRPGLRLLVIEQPRLSDSDREVTSETEWLYSQSNVLIHHLIGNGRILAQNEWDELFRLAGGEIENCQPMGFLGYNMTVVRLQGGEDG
jgi:hypothetical protein